MMLNSFRTRAAICAAGAAVVTALTAGTAIAVADANDDAFIAALKNAGYPVQVQNPAAASTLGRDVCAELAKGVTPDQLAATERDLAATTEAVKIGDVVVTDQMTRAMISAAKQSYCP
jgi:Protein of unknown function (DUF732)